MRRLPLRSPPRMRGKVIVRSRNAVQIGITPAYAGKSARILKRRTEKRDHPRVCGEKLKFGTNVTKNPGSPPRVRGKGIVHVFVPEKLGITPAYAGKREMPSSLMQMDVGPLGSPPRMRGKGELPKDTKDYFGITPAYAGKRQRRATACTWLRDHPRVCGEKDAICKSCPARQGSPSRMRGKAGWPLCGLPCIGITPAYAGKSQPWRSYSQRRWDHPRVCGEKRPAVDGKRPLRGSPPHVRGKVKDPVPVSALVGITPAYAGKSKMGTVRPGAC